MTQWVFSSLSFDCSMNVHSAMAHVLGCILPFEAKLDVLATALDSEN